MGFEVSSTNLLLYALKTHPDSTKIRNILTLGRQNIMELPESQEFVYKKMEYAENYLRFLLPGVHVDSIDFSGYQGSTYVGDLGEQLPTHLNESMSKKYDLVIDFGTIEHIYNVPIALFNASTFLNKNGLIIHALVSNNWVNHGFYQFSPDLFYTLYSQKNGYCDTEVFLVNCNDDKNFYKVNKTVGSKRATTESTSEAYVLVKSTIGSAGFSHSKIYQTDWLPKWNPNSQLTVAVKSKNNIREYKKLLGARFKYIRSLYVILYEYWYWKRLKLFRLEKINRMNPNLQKIHIKTLLS